MISYDQLKINIILKSFMSWTAVCFNPLHKAHLPEELLWTYMGVHPIVVVTHPVLVYIQYIIGLLALSKNR